MAISNLGLTPEEVNSIMRDIGGGPIPTDAVPPGELLQPRTGQSSPLPGTVPQVRVTVPTGAKTPVKVNDSGSPLAPPVAKKRADPTAPIIVGITTGLVFGGPVGGVIGGGAMWVLSKIITPKG